MFVPYSALQQATRAIEDVTMAQSDSIVSLRAKQQPWVRHKRYRVACVIGVIVTLAGAADSIYLALTCFRHHEWLALLSTPNPKLIVSPQLLAQSTTAKLEKPCSCPR